MVSDNLTVANLKANLYTAPWDYRANLQTDLQNFTGWTEGDAPMFPPSANNGDNFMATNRVPLNSSFYAETTDVIIPAGEAGTVKLPQPFAAENVILLTGGICASGTSLRSVDLRRQLLIPFQNSMLNSRRIPHSPSRRQNHCCRRSSPG